MPKVKQKPFTPIQVIGPKGILRKLQGRMLMARGERYSTTLFECLQDRLPLNEQINTLQSMVEEAERYPLSERAKQIQ